MLCIFGKKNYKLTKWQNYLFTPINFDACRKIITLFQDTSIERLRIGRVTSKISLYLS